jgi:hypothetical protein
MKHPARHPVVADAWPHKVRVLGTLAVLCASISMLSACGSTSATALGKEGSGLTNDQALREGSIGACLIKHGASLARSSRDLLFLSRAEEKRGVSKPGLAWDSIAKIVVKVWTESSAEGQPPRWTVWFGEPAGKYLTPIEIVEKRPADSYVVFRRHLTDHKRHRMSDCLTF